MSEPQSSEKITIKRGGWFSRLRHRSQLREYSRKIFEREITFSELQDYLAKGGDPNILGNYGPYNPFMKDTEVPLLNYFINGKNPWGPDHPHIPWEKDQRPELLKCLKLLLDNGASPQIDLKIPMKRKEDSSPLLFASFVGNIEAMELLISYGADINIIQDTASDSFGPPLLVAYDNGTAAAILRHKPDLSVKTPQGYNLVQQLVFSPNYSFNSDEILRRLRWMTEQKLTFTWEPGTDLDPVKRAQWVSNYHKSDKNLNTKPQEVKAWREIAELLPKLRKQ